MTDITPRRRMAGRALLTIGVLALPLTASITYAERLRAQDAPDAPLPPENSVAAPVAPEAPPAPDAPIVVREIEITRDGDGKPVRKVTVVRRERQPADGEAKSEDHAEIERHAKVERYEFKGPSEAEWARIREMTREHMKDAEKAMAEARVAGREAQRLARIEMHAADFPRTRFVVKCDTSASAQAGRTAMAKAICGAQGKAKAAAGIREARDAIANESTMSAEVRAEVLAALDAEIARLEQAD